MTTPDERERNLGWTISTLRDIAQATQAGSSLQQRASQLLVDALTIEDIELLDAASPERVKAGIASIEAARELFVAALQELEDPQIRHALRAILRHYPRPVDFDRWRRMAAQGAPMGSAILRRSGLA